MKQQIENTFFFEGCEVTKEESMYGMALVTVLNDFSLNNRRQAGDNILVRKSSLEPMAFNTYEIGDRIQSKIGELTGIVVAYELHTNKVICVSDKINRYKNDRTRYAYSLSEIKPKQKDGMFEFVLGKVYEVNGLYLFASKADKPYHIDLRNRLGEVVYANIPQTIRLPKLLLEFGINGLEFVK